MTGRPPPRLRVTALAALLLLLAALPAAAQTLPTGRDAAESLRFPRLEFTPVEAEQHRIEGVEVIFARDPALPLVNVFARFRGGYARMDRDFYAAATALPTLLRSGGTTTLTPDSVNALLDFHAIQLGFGTGGSSSVSSLNTLTEHLDAALELWTDILRNPRFDPDQVEVWRGQELERVLRREDNPTGLAFSEFNRLMYGDHTIGWEMAPADLEPERLTGDVLSLVHGEIFCRDHLILGVTGDVSWREIEPRLRAILAEWPACPRELPEPPPPDIRREAAVYLIPKALNQTTVVLAHPGGIRQEDSRDYYASRIGNSILGGGGFSSRLMARVRTERGYAYSASSLWTAPSESEGLIGAVTQTRAGSTVAAVRTILEVMQEMVDERPTREEVSDAIDEIVNGFVFNFEHRAQIVSRQMFYVAEDLPANWLELYVEGIQRVTPADVRRVFRRHLRPSDMTILLVGDLEAFDEPPESLGPLRILEPGAPVPPR
ncbi:MAG: pitrilysin family protein [Gemmatimonadota bacterium]